MASRRIVLPVGFALRASSASLPIRLSPARFASSRSLVAKSVTRPAICVSRQRIVGVRWLSSDPPKESKIWSFEEMQSLTSKSASSSPSSDDAAAAADKITLIDVREPGELAATGRIPGALNIPITSQPDSFHISEDEFEDRFGFARPAPDDEVVFYCKSGVRSRGAAGIAREAGWKRVGQYPGSWMEWFGKGGKVER